jgi:hypothetical protein
MAKYLLSSVYYIEDYYEEDGAVAVFDSEEDAHIVGAALYGANPEGDRRYDDNGNKIVRNYTVAVIPENIPTTPTTVTRYHVVWWSWDNYDVVAHEITYYGSLSTTADKYHDEYTPARVDVNGYYAQIRNPLLQGSAEFVTKHLEEAKESLRAAETSTLVARSNMLENDGGHANWVRLREDSGENRMFFRRFSGSTVELVKGRVYRMFDGTDFHSMAVVNITRGSRISRKGNPVLHYTYTFDVDGNTVTGLPREAVFFLPPVTEADATLAT